MFEAKRPFYQAYLLRCWQEGESPVEREGTWRFSVEQVIGQRQRRGFNHLDDLFAFLRAELGEGDDTKSPPPVDRQTNCAP